MQECSRGEQVPCISGNGTVERFRNASMVLISRYPTCGARRCRTRAGLIDHATRTLLPAKIRVSQRMCGSRANNPDRCPRPSAIAEAGCPLWVADSTGRSRPSTAEIASQSQHSWIERWLRPASRSRDLRESRRPAVCGNALPGTKRSVRRRVRKTKAPHVARRMGPSSCSSRLQPDLRQSALH